MPKTTKTATTSDKNATKSSTSSKADATKTASTKTTQTNSSNSSSKVKTSSKKAKTTTKAPKEKTTQTVTENVTDDIVENVVEDTAEEDTDDIDTIKEQSAEESKSTEDVEDVADTDTVADETTETDSDEDEINAEKIKKEDDKTVNADTDKTTDTDSEDTPAKTGKAPKKKTKAATKKEDTSQPAKDGGEKEDGVVVKKQKKTKSHRTLYIVSIVLSCIAILCSGGTAGFLIYNQLQSSAPLTIHYSGKDGNSTNFTDNSIAAVANAVSPAVVSILTETRYESWTGQTSTGSSAGTGMIVTTDGYVVTNKHVIDGANSISVQTDDGETYSEVQLIGTDPLNDVAFLKIPDVSDLPTVTLGNSKTIVHGQPVVAIGNALGQFQNSVTEGIISGTGRTIVASDSNGEAYERLSDLIQTDASINPGNSGGPLVNAAGEVIGINTAVSTSANGISFAIPISSIKGMLESITKNNRAERAYIGAYYTTVTATVARQYDLPVKSGAYIHSDQTNAVIKGSPADKSGLMEGDIITAVNGEEIGNHALTSIIGEYMPGDTVQLTVLRSTGKEKLLNITLAAYPDDNNQS